MVKKSCLDWSVFLSCSFYQANLLFSDGGINPPQFYYSHDEIMTVLKYYQPDHPALKDPIAAIDSEVPRALVRADDFPPNPIVAPRKPVFAL